MKKLITIGLLFCSLAAFSQEKEKKDTYLPKGTAFLSLILLQKLRQPIIWVMPFTGRVNPENLSLLILKL